MIGLVVGSPRFGNCGLFRALPFASKLLLCLCDSMPCVIDRIGFVFRAVAGDALDHDFGVVTTGEGALRVGPVVLGLALMVARHGPLALSVVARVPGCLGRVFVNCEIAERVNGVALVAGLDDEFLREFTVGESRQTQHARRVGCREVSAELICEVAKERLRLVLTEPAHPPYDLVLTGRGIENKVWRWYIG